MLHEGIGDDLSPLRGKAVMACVIRRFLFSAEMAVPELGLNALVSVTRLAVLSERRVAIDWGTVRMSLR
jgi:hypothetical protein